MHRLLRLAPCALLLSFGSGFDWPGHSARNVSALTAAETTREWRDALRLLRESGEVVEVSALAGALAHVEPGVRVDALAALERSAVPRELLERGLSDGAPAVRVATIELMRTQPATELSLLLSALNDPDPAVRRAAVHALRLHPARDERANVLSALVGALRDPAPEVRTAAVLALAERADQERADDVLSALLRTFDSALPELKVALLDALARHARGRASLEFELALGDEDEQVVLAALRGYAQVGSFPSEQVRALVSSPSPAIASAAEHLLARGEAAMHTAAERQRWLRPLERTALQQLTADEGRSLLAELERTLPIGETLATDPLVDWLTRAPSALQPGIAALCVRSGGVVRASVLLPLLEGAPNAELRALLLTLLARAEGAARLDAVQLALRDRDASVREAAVDALAQTLDPPSTRALLARSERSSSSERKLITRVLAHGLSRLPSIDAQLAEQLCDALEDDDEHDLQHASWRLRALGAVRHRCGRELVLGALDEHRALVRIAALRASVLDRSQRAVALRSAAASSASASVAATAIVAQALAGDSIAPVASVAKLTRRKWPLGPAISFARAFSSTAPERELCPLLDSKEPITRTNALAGLARHPEVRCADQRAVSWLSASSAWPAQRAAAHWMRARLRTGHDSSLQEALDRCAMREPDRRLRDICSGHESTSITPAAARAARALLLEDGRVLLSEPDGAGEVNWSGTSVIAVLPGWLAGYVKE